MTLIMAADLAADCTDIEKVRVLIISGKPAKFFQGFFSQLHQLHLSLCCSSLHFFLCFAVLMYEI